MPQDDIRVKRFIQLPDYFNVDRKSDRFIGNTCDLDFNCAAINPLVCFDRP